MKKSKKTLDNKGCTEEVLMDLSKAFDEVNRGLLIVKLYASEFSKDALKLIINYITDRWQKRKINKFSFRSC